MQTSEAIEVPKILSLSCLYPTPGQPQQGVFVQRRLQALARLTVLRVVAPWAVVRYGNAKGSRVRAGKGSCAVNRLDGCVPVSHTWWFYPPRSGGAIPFWLFLQLLYPLWRLRNTFRFDILDTHFGFPEGITGAMLSSVFRIPFIITLRGNEPKHSESKFQRFLMTSALRRAGRVFTVSERLRQFAIGLGAEPAKVRTVPNGIDPAVFFPRERSACRLKYNLPANQRIIISAGALVERKGHHRVVEALGSILADGIVAHLVIAGGPGPEGEYEKTLRELVSRRDLESSVRFLGTVAPDSIAELMSAADVLCLASSNEGWPNVVHEALACGTPVVATDVGAVPEMLAGGRYGIVIPVNDPRRLKQALEEALIRDWDRSAIGDWGRSRSWSQVATEVLREMEALIAEQHTPRERVKSRVKVSKDTRQCIDG